MLKIEISEFDAQMIYKILFDFNKDVLCGEFESVSFALDKVCGCLIKAGVHIDE